MKKNNLNILFGILGLICPIIGIILYIVWKKSDKEKSKHLMMGSIIGFLVYSIIILFLGTHSTNYINRDINMWEKDIKSGDTVVMVIGASWCSHCHEYKPMVTALANKNNINLYFYEIDTFEEDQANRLKNTFELPNYKGSVPYTVVFKNGVAVASHEGYESEQMMISFFMENGVL